MARIGPADQFGPVDKRTVAAYAVAATFGAGDRGTAVDTQASARWAEQAAARPGNDAAPCPLGGQLLASLAMPHVDWGNVPSWLGAGSLLLAFGIFIRDRWNTDRAQVDRVGVWFTETYERRWPGLGQDQARVEEATIEVHVRNASDLPVNVVRLAYEVRASWMVPTEPQSLVPVHVITAGDGCVQQFLDDFRVPPGETLNMPSPVNVAHLAPAGAVQLSPIRGITAAASWLLVIDNVGRRWAVRPRTGRAVRRRWYRRSEEHWPRRW
jgi:hypothetical protein